MAIAAQLYQDARGTERFRVELDATLRDPSHAPVDVVIEDLSATGFRVVTNTTLELGDEIGLGLAGIGARRARVVWCGPNSYGCEFLSILSRDDMKAALSAPSSSPINLAPLSPWDPAMVPAQNESAERGGLSTRARVVVIAACAVAAWVVAVAVGTVVVQSVSRLF